MIKVDPPIVDIRVDSNRDGTVDLVIVNPPYGIEAQAQEITRIFNGL